MISRVGGLRFASRLGRIPKLKRSPLGPHYLLGGFASWREKFSSRWTPLTTFLLLTRADSASHWRGSRTWIPHERASHRSLPNIPARKSRLGIALPLPSSLET